MNRYICIHGHFYQPPRENPWLEEVEWQDSAYPYHDWNKRITTECYGPNTASRILDFDHKILDIINNYSKISFNFGPTLLSWMERHDQEVYKAILEADKLGQKRFSGHGSALAQVYNHMIMPLANSRDKRTQVLWGLFDFERRFGRKPEGMWLAETAVDTETLEILAEQDLKFTILSPYQARRVRMLGDTRWKDARDGKVDPKLPYLYRLPSGRSIAIFFYDGPISQQIAFGGLLNDGILFANKLNGAFVEERRAQLVHVATDGESYGHHHRYGDMALAYCLRHIELNKMARITVYGEFLSKFPPRHEVKFFENSSWSCMHGVERWRNNCGCQVGHSKGWQQNWRAPLRAAMDWLRDSLEPIYVQDIAVYVKDPWAARNNYIAVVINRSQENVEKFLTQETARPLSSEDKIKILKLLEMQRQAMLMYTSCGWFFDEVSGIETTQVMQYAARAMQLAREVSGKDLEPEYIKMLEAAPSNIPKLATGAGTYKEHIKPLVLDMLRVGAHYAVSSLFEKYAAIDQIYCYSMKSLAHEHLDTGRQKLAVGRATITNDITLEDEDIIFAVVYLGDYNLVGGIGRYKDEADFQNMQQAVLEMFRQGNMAQVVALMDKCFGTHNYSFWHLFKDEQRKVINQVVAAAMMDIENTFQQIYDHHYPVMRVLQEMRIPLPKTFLMTIGLIYNTNLRKLLEGEQFDPGRLALLVKEIKNWSLELDQVTLNYVAAQALNRLMEKFTLQPDNTDHLQHIEAILVILSSIQLRPDLWKVQNIFFALSTSYYPQVAQKAKNDPAAKRWLEYFERLSHYLEVKIVQ